MNNKPRKVRALNMSKNDKDKILEQYNEGKGLKPSEIVKFFGGKYTYFQVYNTINPRPVGTSLVNKDGKIITPRIKADETVTEFPEVDVSDFTSIEKFIEHNLTVLITQLSQKKLTLEKRTWLLNKVTEINKKLKTQLLENHLKNPNAKLVIRIMRRLKPELTDEEILKIFSEESEKMKKLNN